VYDGYLSLAGNEIINSARAVAYARAAGLEIECEPCDSIPEALGDEPYYQVDDSAPWFDANSPESRGFLGVFGMDVAGLNSNPIARTPTALITDGSSLGPMRRTHREIAFTVALITTGECELTYALQWLSLALLGTTCQGQTRTCNGDEVCMFSCCPGQYPTLAGQEVGDAEMRHLYDVGLLTGPQVTEKKYLQESGLIWTTVTFTLAAAKPWIYRDPLTSNVDWVALGTGQVVPTTDPDQVYQQCLNPVPCVVDPLCPDPALPPAAPVPVSPCYPRGVGTFRRSRIAINPQDQPAWSETVPVVEVRTGALAMRRLLVRFWTNPQGGDCSSFTDPCGACADINIAYVPAGSTLRVDGRVQRSVVECPQFPVGTATGTPVIYGQQGSFFDYPAFPCPTGLCIEVWSRSDTTAADATARVLLVPRADLG